MTTSKWYVRAAKAFVHIPVEETVVACEGALALAEAAANAAGV